MYLRLMISKYSPLLREFRRILAIKSMRLWTSFREWLMIRRKTFVTKSISYKKRDIYCANKESRIWTELKYFEINYIRKTSNMITNKNSWLNSLKTDLRYELLKVTHFWIIKKKLNIKILFIKDCFKQKLITVILMKNTKKFSQIKIGNKLTLFFLKLFLNEKYFW